jgi:putative salt-induced outer membrane protein YdiY
MTAHGRIRSTSAGCMARATGSCLPSAGRRACSAQIGAGYRRSRPEDIFRDPSGLVTERVLHDTTEDVIGTAGFDFSHAFNKTTVLTDKFLVEAGSSNTMLHDEIALAVKMTDKLALSVGYGITNNSNPPATIKKLDTVATVNLVFSF